MILDPIYKFHTLKQRLLIVLGTHSIANEEGRYNSHLKLVQLNTICGNL